ncbi:MAG: PHP domain-containing protein [Methanobacterium sp.]|uniref:PHP domain-containing protein n=1 Tax=Methanobacterium sp. TaxID=2164 RepID=UPI003D65594D|nr:PHP domain-containing protein [Methanobacterium sp.]
MEYDLHVHSKYSNDSFLDPAKIIKIAKKKSLKGVAITDHNTIKGGITALKINNDVDFDLIVGAEIRTEYGDILGLFLNEEIKSRNFLEVVDEIKSQDGLISLAHPYRHYEFPEKIIDSVDLIEAFNARSIKSDNIKSLKLAIKYKKAVTAGSDAHLGFEIGKGKIKVNGEIREALKEGNVKIMGSESNYYWVHGLSVLSEKIKKII